MVDTCVKCYAVYGVPVFVFLKNAFIFLPDDLPFDYYTLMYIFLMSDKHSETYKNYLLVSARVVTHLHIIAAN